MKLPFPEKCVNQLESLLAAGPSLSAPTELFPWKTGSHCRLAFSDSASVLLTDLQAPNQLRRTLNFSFCAPTPLCPHPGLGVAGVRQHTHCRWWWWWVGVKSREASAELIYPVFKLLFCLDCCVDHRLSMHPSFKYTPSEFIIFPPLWWLQYLINLTASCKYLHFTSNLFRN